MHGPGRTLGRAGLIEMHNCFIAFHGSVLMHITGSFLLASATCVSLLVANEKEYIGLGIGPLGTPSQIHTSVFAVILGNAAWSTSGLQPTTTTTGLGLILTRSLRSAKCHAEPYWTWQISLAFGNVCGTPSV